MRRRARRVFQQRGREGGDGAGQRLLLLPAGLVAAVEHAVEQFGVGAEHVRVEAAGDLPDVRADRRQCRLDDGTARIREHRGLLGTWWTVHVGTPLSGAATGDDEPVTKVRD